MKQLAVTALALACAANAFAQGGINFFNRVIGADAASTVIAPVFDFDPSNPLLEQHGPTNTVTYRGAPLLGTGFTAALFGGALNTPAANLTFLSQVSFRTQAALAGFNALPQFAPTVPGVDGGSRATFEYRAWNNRGGTIRSWAEVLADPTVFRGTSLAFSPPDSLTIPPATPINLLGMQSFNLHQVPEPSVIALGVLGLGALLLRRRKTQ